MQTYVHLCMEVRDQESSSQLLYILCLERGSFIGPGAHSFSKTSWPRSQEILASPPLLHKITGRASMSGFIYGSWDLNSGPYAYVQAFHRQSFSVFKMSFSEKDLVMLLKLAPNSCLNGLPASSAFIVAWLVPIYHRDLLKDSNLTHK